MVNIYLYTNDVIDKQIAYNLKMFLNSECKDIEIELSYNELTNKIKSCIIRDTKQNITYSVSDKDKSLLGDDISKLLKFESYYKLYVKYDYFVIANFLVDKFKVKAEEMRLKRLSAPYIKIINEEIKNKEQHKLKIDKDKMSPADYGVLGKYKRVAKSRCIEYFLNSSKAIFENYDGFLSKSIIQTTLKNNLHKQPNNSVVLKLLKSINYKNHISKTLQYDIENLEDYLLTVNEDYQTLIFIFKNFDDYF
ncbi:MAG: hypothetical protein U9Q33_13510 [Campylobacterota bacterium]|nr:hypothetical protein [Campylobacterota bacterium]